MKDGNAKTKKTCGYAPINGLKMYYEIEGTGDPLVYIPAAFGVAGVESFPALVQIRSVITADLQGHGRTADIPERPVTLQQHAEDVIGLLGHLGITKADFLGESYGGAVATIIALRHPGVAGRIATYGATFGPPQAAADEEMLRFSVPPTPDSRCFEFQRENYKRVAPDPDYWPAFLGKMSSIEWNGFSNAELASIKAPLLIAVGDHDFVRIEHAVETFRAMPNVELAVIPDAGHFVLHSEPDRVMPVVQHFLQKPERQIPIATAETGYHRGETR